MMTRRHAMKTAAFASAAVAILPGAIAQTTPATTPAPVTGQFTLPPLPYAFGALEPYIDAQTMQIHHDKHHAAYVANLNKAVADYPDLGKMSVEELVKNLDTVPEKIRTAVRNNGGGHYNHSIFWQMMKKDGGGEPKGDLAEAIETSFGSFTNFKIKFSESATKVFGSGWVWLVGTPLTALTLETTSNQDSPVMAPPASKEMDDFAKDYNIGKPVSAKVPVLGLDVWEHAYYLKYQNKRADYIAAWWNVVNWDFVSEQYLKAKG